jgi:hypothetical protein
MHADSCLGGARAVSIYDGLLIFIFFFLIFFFLMQIHVWAVHGLSVSMTDFMLFLQTRAVVNKIRARLTSLKVFLTIDKSLPDASQVPEGFRVWGLGLRV